MPPWWPGSGPSLSVVRVVFCVHRLLALGVSKFRPPSTGVFWPDKKWLPFPCGLVSLFCASLHTACWQFDPCHHYQVEYKSRLANSYSAAQWARRLNVKAFSGTPVVLVRTTEKRSSSVLRFLTHWTVAAASFSFGVREFSESQFVS